MDVKEAGSALDSLISSFNTRIAELQELVIARNMYPASSVTDLSAVDAALKAMELQVQQIKERLREETEAIPKAKLHKGFCTRMGVCHMYLRVSLMIITVSAVAVLLVPTTCSWLEWIPSSIYAWGRGFFFVLTSCINSALDGRRRRSCSSVKSLWAYLSTHAPLCNSIGNCQRLEICSYRSTGPKLIEASLRQQKKLQSMSVLVPSHLPERISAINPEPSKCLLLGTSKAEIGLESSNQKEEPAVLPKEKKGRGSPPLWYITSEELDSLSSYMRGRLTLDKVNAAINDMSTYAEATTHLITAPRKKLAENVLDKALELREIASTETVKGKHFFLETDIKGPSLKLDNTGKAVLTVLRHLGRISEMRIGHHRVFILSKPQ